MDNFTSVEFDFNSASTLSSSEDFDFAPISRDRANTWPQQQVQMGGDRHNLTPTGNFSTIKFETIPTLLEPSEMSPSLPPMQQQLSEPIGMVPTDLSQMESVKKPQKTPHRNAWGDASYADLITQAIESTPDKRMTLAQIYDWIIQNVPYFRDKGVEFSAGWKNSIRHNLSLRTRFIRCQNETAGKSSWWMIDPEVKAKKSTRPRAGSAGMIDQQRFRSKKYPSDACKLLESNSRDSDVIDVVGLGNSKTLTGNNQWSKHNGEISNGQYLSTTEPISFANFQPEPHIAHSSCPPSSSIYGKIPAGSDNFTYRHSIYPTDLRHFITPQTSGAGETGQAVSELPPYAHQSNSTDYNQLANLDGWMFPDEIDSYPGLYELGFNKLWQR